MFCCRPLSLPCAAPSWIYPQQKRPSLTPQLWLQTCTQDNILFYRVPLTTCTDSTSTLLHVPVSCIHMLFMLGISSTTAGALLGSDGVLLYNRKKGQQQQLRQFTRLVYVLLPLAADPPRNWHRRSKHARVHTKKRRGLSCSTTNKASCKLRSQKHLLGTMGCLLGRACTLPRSQHRVPTHAMLQDPATGIRV